MQVTVAVKSIGQKRSKLKLDTITLDNLHSPCTLKCFLLAMVEQQLTAFNQKKVADPTKDQTQTPLSENYLDLLTQTGKAGFELRYNEKQADLEAAQENALQCFEDGVFAVFVNDEEIRKLDYTLSINDDTVISFVRLTFLAGGYF